MPTYNLNIQTRQELYVTSAFILFMCVQLKQYSNRQNVGQYLPECYSPPTPQIVGHLPYRSLNKERPSSVHIASFIV